MDDEARKKLRRFEVDWVRNFDQQLPTIRAIYEGMPPEEKADFRMWLEKIVEANKLSRQWWEIGLQLSTAPIMDDEGNVVQDASDPPFSAEVLLNAVRAWEKGDDFTPKGMFDTFQSRCGGVRVSLRLCGQLRQAVMMKSIR